MYSCNAFNARNDCIHGRRYQHPLDVAVSYRLTVICTCMMLKMKQGLEMAAEVEAD